MRSSSIPHAITATCPRCSTSRAWRRCTRHTPSTRAPTSRNGWALTTTASTTCREMRSPPRSSGSWAAGASFRMLLVVGLLAGACSSPQNTSTQPSPTASASAAASPSISISPGAESPVPAWRFYADVSASVLGLGLNPSAGQVEAAICDDFKRGHATKVEEDSGYKLASTYYGWNFSIDPEKVTCQ